MSYGLYAYGVAAGASVMIALVFFLLGLRRPANRAAHLALTFLAVTATANAVVHIQLQSARNVNEYGTILKGPFALIGVLTLVAFVWVIGTHSSVAYPAAPLVLTGASVAVAAVNFATPNGLLVDELTGLREVTLFGDSFVLHEPSRSPWRFVLDGYLVAVAGYALVAAYVRIRRRRRRGSGRSLPAIYTTIGLGLVFIIALYDSLVDEALVQTPYLSPFGVLFLALGLALAHTERVTETERQLLSYSTELETIVHERTKDLAKAHDRVIDQLEHQRQTAEHLANISHQFVLLNGVALRPGRDHGFQLAVERVLACVGEVVSADNVELELNDSASSDSEPFTVSWHVPGQRDGTTSSPSVVRRVLTIGDLQLGNLTMSWPSEPDLSDQQLQLIGLVTDYLAAVLHRLDIQASLVIGAVDSERHRIARELHDSVSQRLYAAAFNAEYLQSSIAQSSIAQSSTEQPDLLHAAERAAEIRNLVHTSVAEMRTLLFELQPKMLETTSLTGLLVALCESVESGHHQPIDVIAVGGPSVPSGPKLAIYRIAQEALSNALRHADATSIQLRVEIDDDGVLLDVEDDGRGFEPDSVEGGYGLDNMAERASQIGSELHIETSPGNGTTVSLRWRFAEATVVGRTRAHARLARATGT